MSFAALIAIGPWFPYLIEAARTSARCTSPRAQAKMERARRNAILAERRGDRRRCRYWSGISMDWAHKRTFVATKK